MGLTASVVANAPILSTWGNEIRDRTVQQFASAAERSAQWTSPPDGAVAFLRDVDQLHVFSAGVWVCITPVSAYVATLENRASATYGDYGTVGPTVSIQTGTKALVTVGAEINNAGGGAEVYAAVAVSGATTRAAADAESISVQGTAVVVVCSKTTYLTGLTAGTNTFTMKYRSVSGSVYAQYRSLTVVGIP